MLDENSEAHAEHNALILKGLHRAEGRFLDLLGIAPYYYFSQYFQGVFAGFSIFRTSAWEPSCDSRRYVSGYQRTRDT
jgi:hypothetical protein